ncbi:MAG TPA: hypothetical protein VK630_04275 [Reyranella sp.]|nr:hypothetical protein [Reyranella sp.]
MKLPPGHREIVGALASWPRDFPRAERDRCRADGWTIIEPGTPAGARIGFNSRDWKAESFLAVRGDEIQISLISAKCPGRGAFSRLLARIESAGRVVRVVSPLPVMQTILIRKGFTSADLGTRFTVWSRP